MKLQSAPSHSVRPTRLLVIQLARLGDTIQSLMALRTAKQLYPNLEIHFVARQRFAHAVKKVPWIDQVFALPTEDLIGPVLRGATSEAEGVRDLARWVSPLVEKPWDFVFNWTYSDASSYLTALLPGRVKLGFSRRQDLSFFTEDGWSQYVQAIVQGQIEQNIHLTDILTTQLLTVLQIHLGEPADAGNLPVTSKSFFGCEGPSASSVLGNSSLKWVSIQLGAGHASKTWEAASWAKFARYLLDRHSDTGLVILGGKEDEARYTEFRALLGEVAPERLVSLVGATDFDLWARVIAQSEWLAAADTGAIHLASILGTRVLNVSVGPVRHAETGPYGNGHYIVAPAQPCPACTAGNPDANAHICRTLVSAEAVYATWLYGATEWSHQRQQNIEAHFSQLGWNEALAVTQVMRSRIRNPDDGGGVIYEPLIHRTLRLADWGSLVLGHVARAWYCGWTPPVGHELSRELVSPSLVHGLRQVEEVSGVLAKILVEGRQTASALSRRASTLKSENLMKLRDREELHRLGQKLLELDGLVERAASTAPVVGAFARMAKVLMHNLEGNQIAELGASSAAAYQQLITGLNLLREWTTHTLSLARPAAVEQGRVIDLASARARKEMNP